MPRPRTGSAFLHGDHWDIQITYPGGGRSNRMCQPPGMSEAKARDKARRLTEIAAKEAVPKRPKKGSPEAGELVSDYAERWCDAREEHGLTSAKDDTVTRLMLEQFVEQLDENVRAGLLSWKTARNAWGAVSKLFDDACRSKVLALRVREDNPALGVRPPDEGVKKSKAYLYPSEFLAVIMCERVPIRWRQLFAIAIYTYTREGALEALEREDVDLDHSVIHIHGHPGRRAAQDHAARGAHRLQHNHRLRPGGREPPPRDRPGGRLPSPAPGAPRFALRIAPRTGNMGLTTRNYLEKS